ATILNSSAGSGNTTATITTTATGGSGSFTFQWYADNSIVSGGTTSTYVFSSSDAGVHNIYCEVTDTNSHYVAVTQDVLVNVVGGLSVGVSPTSLDAAVGYQFTLVGSVSGGSGNYSYQWLQNSSASPVGATVVGSSQSYNGKFNSTGVWYYYFVATDNVTNNSATSSAVVVTVSSDIFATLSASETNVVVNSTVTLTLNIFGGNGNWTATWYQIINGTQTVLASGSVSTLQVSQSSPTSADYFVIVSDTSNGNPYKTSTVHITWATFVANISSSSSMVSTGTSYIITMSESGGVTPLTYTLYENGTSIYSSSKTNSNSISDSISKNTAGTYSYYVTVIDYNNNSATSGAISVIVTSNIGLNLTTSTSLIPYNSGQVATLTATAANVSGTPSYNIYEISPSGSVTQVVTNSTVNTYVFNPSGLAQGKYTFYATVSGSNGSATSNNVNIEYSKASAVSTTVSISDSLTYKYIAGGGSISANSPSGQTGNFTVTWNGTVVPAFDITLDRRLNYAGELDFKVPKGYSMNKNDLIQFYYWGNAVFIGRVKEVTKYSDYVYEVKAYDGLYELGGITYGMLPRSSNMSIDSMLKYFINQCKYFGYGTISTWYQITQPVGVDFGGSNVLPYLLQLVFAYNGHIAMDNYGNINLFTTSGTTVATRTITENIGGFIVKSKEYDNTRIYTKITAVAFDTDKNNQKVSYSTGTGNGKVIGDGWLYLNDSEINGVLQTIANNIIGQTSEGNYIVTVWTGAHTTFDFIDNYNGSPYLYTINFADGSSLSYMLLAGIKITQDGVTYTFKQYDDTIIDYLLTSIEK
ncbi:MAG: hypothetical protein QXJ23_10700, partial [Thermofilum sp.]|uniref:hypothetical protein n=1 Tax=Thermofilum sp. TaxID=1961369 RepID=UPI00317C05A5